MIADLLKPEVQQFMKENAQADPALLSLKYHQIAGTDIKLIAEQIKARQKAAKKFPEIAENLHFIFPSAIAVEQSSSLETAQYKANLLSGNLAYDLTGGLGIDSIALSKNFNNIIYIEQDPIKALVAEHNFKLLNISNIKVVNSTAEAFLKTATKADLIYLDPDRRAGNERVISLKQSTPNILEIQDQLIDLAEKILIKCSPMLDVTATIGELKFVNEVHSLAVNNECKELLFLQTRNYQGEVKLIANNHQQGKWITFTSLFAQDHKAVIAGPGKFIYEPNAAILKLGIQDFLDREYLIRKLHPSTQLFTSDEEIKNFPGRGFELLQLLPVNKKALKKYLPELKANLATRNFPEPVEKLKKNLGIKDGGNYYLFGCRIADLTYKLLLTNKL